jgi:hypothetical protein
METEVILMLGSFILGLIIGVILTRPQIIK